MTCGTESDTSEDCFNPDRKGMLQAHDAWTKSLHALNEDLHVEGCLSGAT